MTVKELKEKLNDFPDESVVIRKIPGEYEDFYVEATNLKNCNYSRFGSGHVSYSGNSNAVILI